jgi:hypothetical protein
LRCKVSERIVLSLTISFIVETSSHAKVEAS